MTRTIAITLSLALMCSTTAWAQDEAQQPGAQPQPGAAAQQDQPQPQPGAAAGQDAAAPASEAQPAGAREQAQQDPTQMFVTETYNANMFEIKAGELAAQRAQDDQVKQFARQMVQDHQKANQQLKQVAQSKQIMLKEQLDPMHQAKLQKLQQCSAQDFGRKYINSQAAGHMMQVLEFRYQSQNLQDAELKQWAMQMTPKLEEHLKHATQIATKMAGGMEAQPAGAREPAEGTPSQRPGQTGTDTGTGATDPGTSGERPGQQPGERGTGAPEKSSESGAGTGTGTAGQPGQQE